MKDRDKVESHKVILPCLSHFMHQRFARVGLLLRLVELSIKPLLNLGLRDDYVDDGGTRCNGVMI